MTEREKMEAGLWYDANYDRELLELRDRADELCFLLNQTSPAKKEERAKILKELLPQMGEGITILTPFHTDYGIRCVIGDGTFINHGAYLMDGGGIRIGKMCFIGPNFGAYTAVHALRAEERNRGLEKAVPVVLGDNVWIGASVSVLPGISIGDNSVIGAGSVVTKDIPANVVAAGNPCRVLRPITEKDRCDQTEE